ncbi:hypothetical protein [Methylophilus sp. TWE2]|uniref:hypothetical protein n=1 Tax=Methylophilus sp. TWE2 TaxID=1662285 RepID=UPI000671576C|nr:hypothetical protein [Methylophilus sp. TWE2]AKR42665.1 hypothetical protein ACJ67_03940 [Methylophilus sp. TWE2]
MTQRWWIWASLAFTLLACWWVEQAEQPEQVLATASPAPAVKRRMPLAQVMPALKVAEAPAVSPDTRLALAEDPGVDLFAVLEMPADNAAEVQVAEAVNPYTYAGRLQEEGRWVVFLTDGQQQYVVHEGDHFAEGWRVAVLDQQKVVLQHAAERFEIRLDNGVVF